MSNLINITIDDTSPTFIYQPWGEGGSAGLNALSEGWSTLYDQLGYLNVNGGLPRGDSPAGTSYHVTGFNGASVSLSFHGSAVYVFGTSNCTYDVILDSTTTTKTVLPGVTVGDSLAVFDGLMTGDHTITLRPHPSDSSQRLALDRAIVTMDTAQSSTVNQTDINNQNTAQITYSPPGSWWSSSDNGVPSPFYQTGGVGSSAALNFTGHAVALYGSLNWGHQLYNVSLDGHVQTFNGSSYWKVGETLLYFQSGLTLTTPHTVELIDAVAANVTLTRMTVWQDTVHTTATPTASHKSKVNGGAIAGGVIGATLLFALVIGAAFWYLRRRDKQRDIPEIGTPPLDGTATPYDSNNNWKPETTTTPWTPGVLPSVAATTEATQSQTSLASPPAGAMSPPPGILPRPTHPREKGGDPTARPSPLSSSGSPISQSPVTTAPWQPSTAEQSSLGFASAARVHTASPLPPGARGPAPVHYADVPLPQVNLSPDAVEHIFQQLAARIDPAAAPPTNSSAPPMYPTS